MAGDAVTRALRAAALIAALAPAAALADGAGPVAGRPAPPLPTLTVPAGWTAQPALADAARAAATAEAGPRPLTIDAWGDPLRGCFATAIAIGLRARDGETMADVLRTQLATAVSLDGWTAAGGLIDARLARPGWQGTLRALISERTDLRATVIACFYNDRAPARCEAGCRALLGSLPASFALPAPPGPGSP